MDDSSAAALLSPLVAAQVSRLASGEQEEDLPEIIAVVQAREAVLASGAAEAIEGRERDVLLVIGGTGHALQTGAGQSH